MSIPPNLEPLLDSFDLALKMGVATSLIDDLRRSGQIPFVRLGERTYRFQFSKVVAALEQPASLRHSIEKVGAAFAAAPGGER